MKVPHTAEDKTYLTLRALKHSPIFVNSVSLLIAAMLVEYRSICITGDCKSP